MTKTQKQKVKKYKNKDVFTILEAMDFLQVGRTKIDALIEKGEIKVIKLCEKHLVLKVELLHYLNKTHLPE